MLGVGSGFAAALPFFASGLPFFLRFNLEAAHVL